MGEQGAKKLERAGISRRDFLKLGTAGAASAIACEAEAGPAASGRELAEGERQRYHPENPARTVKTVCNVCFWRCGVEAEIGEDGSLLHIRGNPRHPASNGMLCPRGVGGICMHHDPDRLTHPQIRQGRRGEGLFRRAGWDEGFAEAARLLRRVIEEDGPGSVAFLTHGMSDHHFGYLARVLGTPHQAGPAYGQCKGPRDVAFKLTFGHRLGSPEEIDLENARCIVLLGSHLGENMHNSQVQELVEARQRGAHLVVVDPRRSTAADKADQWLRIKPGTDLALLLAWTHILIRDQAFDEDFVERHCSGFEQLREHVLRYDPSWASEETGLSVESIEESARAIARAAPEVVLHPGRHVVWHGNDTQRSRALAILVAITGSWGSKGGYYLSRKIALPSPEEAFPEVPELPEMAARRDPGFPFAYASTIHGIRQATLEGKIRAWVVSGTNLLHSVPGEHETRLAMEKLDALIVVDILPTETTKYADVLLPATSYLEHHDFLFSSPGRDPFVAILQDVAPKIGESRCECEIAGGIGRALGLERYFVWRSETEYAERCIDWHNRRNPSRRIDMDELRREGVVVFDDQGAIYRSGKGLGPTGEGRAGAPMRFPEWNGEIGENRVRLYSPDLERVYREMLAAGENAAGLEPLPTYYRVRGGPPGHVRLNYGRSPVHSFSRTQNLPALHGREPENEIWISPRTALAFGGLQDGEQVDLINQDGVREGPIRLKVTSRIRDDAAYMTHGHGHNSRQLSRSFRRGAHLNRLTSHYVIDPICGATAMRVNFVRITRPRGA
ncbi:MAG: molybdopterin-containing oxidoreductase family protein [Myxococcota bacterium]